MKRFTGIICASFLLLIWSGAANAAGLVSVNFIMPTGVDPLTLDFTFNGETYNNISGLQLLPISLGGGGGIDLRVPHPVSNTAFNDFAFSSNYDGTFVLNPSVGPSFTSFQPWALETGSNGHEVGAQKASALVGQPDILLNRYYAHVEVDTISGADVAAFGGSTFAVTGFAIPEPGMLALASAVALTGLLEVRRRRMKR